MPGREMLISWLKDAHAMERALVSVLEKHAGDAEACRRILEEEEMARFLDQRLETVVTAAV